MSCFIESLFLRIRKKALKSLLTKIPCKYDLSEAVYKARKRSGQVNCSLEFSTGKCHLYPEIVIFWVNLRLWVKPFNLLDLRQKERLKRLLKPKMFAIAMLYKADVEHFTRCLLAIENCVSETYFFLPKFLTSGWNETPECSAELW